MSERRKKEHGPTTKTVARNVRRLRERQGLSAAKLSARTAEIGYEIATEGVQKIEAAADGRPGARHVNADELMVLALALNVTPVTLLLPMTDSPEQQCQVTGLLRQVPADEVWEWAMGRQPLVLSGQEHLPGTFREAANPGWFLRRLLRGGRE